MYQICYPWIAAILMEDNYFVLCTEQRSTFTQLVTIFCNTSCIRSHTRPVGDSGSPIQGNRGLQHETKRNNDHNYLSSILACFCKSHATLQWIFSHCNVTGNEAADSYEKEGTTEEQVDRAASYPAVKAITEGKQHSKWIGLPATLL